MSMIIEAILKGDVKLVEDLINIGIDVNHIDEDGCQPLSVAACDQNPKIVQILLNAGATVSKDLSFAVAACDHYNGRTMELLIQAGLEVDPTILEEGETFLMQAAQRGDLEAVMVLVEAGADVNRVDREYNFPLANAGHGKHEEVFKYLAPLTSPELRKIAADQLPSRYGRILRSIRDSDDNDRICRTVSGSIRLLPPASEH